MTFPSPYDLARRFVAALLAVALVLAAWAPGSAATPPQRVVVIGGIAISLCADGKASDTNTPHHDCGLCCLRHVSALPPAPVLTLPVRLARAVEAPPASPHQAPPALRRGAHAPRAPPTA